MSYANLKHWTVTFDAAVDRILDARPGCASDCLQLTVEPCPDHGATCAVVTYGALMEHIHWDKADPAALALKLLDSMLPVGRLVEVPVSSAGTACTAD